MVSKKKAHIIKKVFELTGIKFVTKVLDEMRTKKLETSNDMLPFGLDCTQKQVTYPAFQI